VTADVIPITVNRRTHEPSRRLVEAFEQHGWIVTRVFLARATLVSPDREHEILIRVDVEQSDHVVEVHVDGQPVDIDEATDFVTRNSAPNPVVDRG
jgi:hypothetical protein